MSDTAKEAAPKAATKTGGAELRVRVTAKKMKAKGFTFGKGAETLLPEDKAKALQAAGLCVIIGA